MARRTLGNLDGASEGTGGTDGVRIEPGTGNFIHNPRITTIEPTGVPGTSRAVIVTEVVQGPPGPPGPQGEPGADGTGGGGTVSHIEVFIPSMATVGEIVAMKSLKGISYTEDGLYGGPYIDSGTGNIVTWPAADVVIGVYHRVGTTEIKTHAIKVWADFDGYVSVYTYGDSVAELPIPEGFTEFGTLFDDGVLVFRVEEADSTAANLCVLLEFSGANGYVM